MWNFDRRYVKPVFLFWENWHLFCLWSSNRWTWSASPFTYICAVFYCHHVLLVHKLINALRHMAKILNLFLVILNHFIYISSSLVLGLTLYVIPPNYSLWYYISDFVFKSIGLVLVFRNSDFFTICPISSPNLQWGMAFLPVIFPPL